MKAVVYHKNGGPAVFEYTDAEVPAVSPNEVLIRNEYISIEGGDLIAREIVPPERVPHIVGYRAPARSSKLALRCGIERSARRS